MFERFTERSRHIIVMAQEEARLDHHSQIGTGHLLVAFLREGEGVAAHVLAAHGLRLDTARQKVMRLYADLVTTDSKAPPFTHSCKEAFSYAYRESVSLGHNYIGSEHMLLALTTPALSACAAASILREMEVPDLRQAVMDNLAGYEGDPELTLSKSKPQLDPDQRIGEFEVSVGWRQFVDSAMLNRTFGPPRADIQDAMEAFIALGNGLPGPSVRQCQLLVHWIDQLGFDFDLSQSANGHMLRQFSDNLKLRLSELTVQIPTT